LIELLALFNNNILPIFLSAGTGFLAARHLQVTPRSVSQVAFYIFSPCLIFNLLTKNPLQSGEVTRLVLFTLVVVLGLGLLTFLVGLALRFERSVLVALLLTVMFGNTGNYGLSLNLFAFGQSALVYASLYFATVGILVYTVGVLIASLGKSSLKKAFLGLFKVPTLYAILLALLFNRYHLRLPLPIDRTVELLAGAAIPVLMVVLGVQLYNSRWSDHKAALGLSVFLRLVVSPLLAMGIALLFRLEGAAYQAGVLESAVPTAVMMTVVANEYETEPSFVTSAVIVSTLLSPLTITPLLAWLGA
jgi:hypothetical protein